MWSGRGGMFADKLFCSLGFCAPFTSRPPQNNDGVIDIEEFLGIMKATSIY